MQVGKPDNHILACRSASRTITFVGFVPLKKLCFCVGEHDCHLELNLIYHMHVVRRRFFTI